MVCVHIHIQSKTQNSQLVNSVYETLRKLESFQYLIHNTCNVYFSRLLSRDEHMRRVCLFHLLYNSSRDWEYREQKMSLPSWGLP